MTPVVPLSRFSRLVDGLDHPECVTWGPDGFVYAGGEAGQIYRVSLEGQVEQVGSTGGFVLGLCLDGRGNVYACDSGRGAVMVMSATGAVHCYFSGPNGSGLVSPNYPVFDRVGNLYVSESGDFHADNGRLWVVRPGGYGEVFREDVVSFPNGMALDNDEEFLYVVVSTLPGVVRVPLRGGAVEVVLTFGEKVPDGVAFDSEGNLYVSCYTPDEIWRVDHERRLDLFASDWESVVLAEPTNIAFCGPKLDTLVVGSLGRWHLSQAKLNIIGQPYNYPELPE